MESRCLGCMHIKHDPVCEHCGFDERTRNQKHQLPIGSEVGGQYILGRVLGQGGFGITYIAWDKIMHQTVAIKEYFPSGFAGRDTHDHSVSSYDDREKNTFESNKKRFLREAESLAKLWNIPEIVKILRCFEENGTAYIAMEYVEGMDLRRYLKQLGRPMTMEEVLSILGPVMDALEQVHRANLVHRDISPDNIMVLPDGSAKLLDFGAARYVENADAEKDRNTSTQAILKHGFAPPEQYSSHGALGPWTDVYAMCATIYYCLTGKVPTEAMLRVMEGQEIQWNRIQNMTSKQRNALIKGMEISPKNRFTSVKSLYHAFSAKDSPRSSHGRYEQPKVKTVRHNSVQKISISFLIVLLAIVVVLFSVSAFWYGKLRNSASIVSVESSDPFDTAPRTPTETDTIPESESTYPEPTITPYVPLEIYASMDLDNVQYGHTEKIAILSGPPAQSIQWTSSDPRIASVSEDGTITALGFGTTEITADYYGDVQVCTVSISLKGNADFKYSENSTGITINGLNDAVAPNPLVIPCEIDGKPVTEIGHTAFAHYTSTKNVIIADTVTYIAKYAFSGNSNLSNLFIPDSVSKIDDRAFSGCMSLTSLFIPGGVVSIGNYTFSSCISLEELVLSEGIQHLGNYAFEDCSKLISVTIPSTLMESSNIMGFSFTGCTNLKSVEYADGSTKTVRRLFWNCNGITSVILPNSITEISRDTFNDCSNLEQIHIPDGTVKICQAAFKDCQILYDVYIPESVTVIDYEAFLGTIVREVTISRNCTYQNNSFPPGCIINYY